MNSNGKQHRAILQGLAHQAMLDRGLLPDAEPLNYLEYWLIVRERIKQFTHFFQQCLSSEGLLNEGNALISKRDLNPGPNLWLVEKRYSEPEKGFEIGYRNATGEGIGKPRPPAPPSETTHLANVMRTWQF